MGADIIDLDAAREDGFASLVGEDVTRAGAIPPAPPPPLKSASAPDPGTGGSGKKKPMDWGKYNFLLENFALIYGTDTVWDGDKRLIMRIGNMAHAHGSDYVRMWKASESRWTVMPDDVVFDPTNQCGEHCVNLYDGFALKAKPCKESDVDVMLQLLDHLCKETATEGVNVDDIVHFVLCWLALPLQRPGAKLKTALIFHGPQGTGKNLFFDAVRVVYGKYGVMVGQNELEEKYNSWLSAKLMIIANEVVTRQELYHNKNKLKWIVSEDKIPIRAMQQDVRWEANHANLVFLSNEQQPMVLEGDDRRHLVVYTPVVDDGDLYTRVVEFLRAGGAEKWFHFLLHYDIGDFNEHTKPPMTEAKADLIELSMRPTEKFMHEWSKGYLPLPMRVCSAEQLYRAFRRWCDQAGEKYPPPRTQFTHGAVKWAKERVERDADGKRKPPKFTYKVVSFKTAAGSRSSLRVWLPRGCGAPEGVAEGEWANEAVGEFEAPLAKFCRTHREDQADSPVTPDA